MSTDPNAAILQALEAMERRLVERIDGVDARVSALGENVSREVAGTNARIDTLRGDMAGLAREIIEAADRSVREAEGRIGERVSGLAREVISATDATLGAAEQRIVAKIGEAWRETAAHVDATAKGLDERITALEREGGAA